VSHRRALALQPLPNLTWPGATGYSEFPSLGIARLADDAAAFGVGVSAGHPRTPEDIEEALTDETDVVVVGDLRFYAYFANPLPQVSAAVRAIRGIGWEGPVVVAGRHAAHLAGLADEALTVATSYSDLITFLTGLAPTEHGLGADGDTLPGPGVPDMAVLADGADLPGSFSRPGSRMGQLVLSKGCPFTCAFCEKAGQPVTSMSSAQLQTALDQFAQHQVERIIFWDEVFAWPHQAHREQIAMLSAARISFNCNARLDSLNPGFIKILANAGCKEILFGLELIYEMEPELGGYFRLDKGKQRGVSFITDRVAALRDHGIAPVGSIIVGLPGDDAGSIARRIEVADSLGLSHCYVRPLVPFPESAIYRELQLTGSIPEFIEWDQDDYASFPHGYPTLGRVPRSALAACCGR
jgi:hypothetical protein